MKLIEFYLHNWTERYIYHTDTCFLGKKNVAAKHILQFTSKTAKKRFTISC